MNEATPIENGSMALLSSPAYANEHPLNQYNTAFSKRGVQVATLQ
jgi:hypothetical protein